MGPAVPRDRRRGPQRLARPAHDGPGGPLTRDDLPTLAATGVLAATVAAFAHETLGHAGACIATGGEVMRLTSIFFQCRPGTDLTDAAGPLAGLACGGLALGALRLRGTRRPGAGDLFLFMLAAIALLWMFGQLARDSLMRMDDWAFLARRVGRFGPAVAGVVGYVGVVAWLSREARRLAAGDALASRRRLLAPLAAAALSAAVAGAMWPADRLGSAKEGLLTVGLAPLGVILALGAAARASRPDALGAAPLSRDWRWIAAAAVAFALFAGIQGQGIGPGV